jgi:hypothetical protein
MILYRIMYFMMLIGFSYVSCSGSTWQLKVIGILYTITNAILFWR